MWRDALLVVAALAGLAPRARADRPWHGGLGAGGSLIGTGAQGDRGRLDVAADVKPHSRFGAIVAWRAFDADHHGLATAGLIYEAGAARPRLVLDLYADVGADLDARAPLAGGGVRTTLTIIGPLAIALDSGAQLVVDGVSQTRLQLATGALLVARF